MATGVQSTDSKYLTLVRLIDGATTTTSVPSGAPTATPADGVGFAFATLMGIVSPTAELRVRSTAGSGAMDVTVKMWGYSVESGTWAPLGTGTGAAKGIVNGGAVIDEGPVADTIRHSEPIAYLHHLDGIYAQITAINGTSTAVTVEIALPRTNRQA